METKVKDKIMGKTELLACMKKFESDELLSSHEIGMLSEHLDKHRALLVCEDKIKKGFALYGYELKLLKANTSKIVNHIIKTADRGCQIDGLLAIVEEKSGKKIVFRSRSKGNPRFRCPLLHL
jgi:hypothetical protein